MSISVDGDEFRKLKTHIADMAEKCLMGEITYREFADSMTSELSDDQLVGDIDYYLQHMPPETMTEIYQQDHADAMAAIDRLRQSISHT